MAHASSLFRYSKGEEIANSLTHGLGALLAAAGLVVLVCFAATHGNAWHIVSCSIFGAALFLLYLASTLYHAVYHPGAKAILRILDHAAILVLIAGTYTPFTLVSLRGPWGWSLFGLIWGLAVAGILFEITRIRRFRGWLIALYVTMGWAVVAAIRPMLANVDNNGLWLLLAGGLAYTGGIVFYLWRRLPYNHAIWHLFVLAGSTLHYFAVLFHVIPPASGLG
ncbi:MAG: hemolysin III family protein [Desulfobulbus sp.]|nr:hemolysin III family protein [Desulfobulbus sp.]